MVVFNLSERFTKEETCSRTDRIRGSSRSVCVNFEEAYRKDRYPAYFISKLTVVDGENTGTQVRLDHVVACDHATEADVAPIRSLTDEVGLMRGAMRDHPEESTARTPGKARREPRTAPPDQPMASER